MSNFTTELMTALFKGEGVEEIMRLECIHRISSATVSL